MLIANLIFWAGCRKPCLAVKCSLLGYQIADLLLFSRLTKYSFGLWLRFFKEDWNTKDSWAHNKDSPLQVAGMIKAVPVNIRNATITMRTRPNINILATDLDKVVAGTLYSPWNDYQPKPIQVGAPWWKLVKDHTIFQTNSIFIDLIP